jgi:iron complex transport system substrate-binding protein
MAGGVDMLSNPRGDSITTLWSKVVKYDPEVLVIAPCGFDTKRSMSELHLLDNRPEWKSLQSVKSGNVFIADFDLFTQPSASTLVDGIEVLAALFHPEIFCMPERLSHKVVSLKNQPAPAL